MTHKLDWERAARLDRLKRAEALSEDVPKDTTRGDSWHQRVTRRAGVCHQCGGPILAGTRVWIRKSRGHYQRMHQEHTPL